MRIIKPKALRRGDVIGIAAPASPPVSEEKLASGIRYLEQLGYRLELGSNLYHRRGYLAGTDEERVSDIHQLFSNTNVNAIFTARGGYGSMRILSLLDYRLIQKNPKILVGYSDITALQLALFTKIGLITFSGPMVSVEMAQGLTGNAEEQFWKCLTYPQLLPPIRITKQKKKIYHKGRTSGRLLGGNLSLIVSLIGTPYFPTLREALWLLEDTGERPYRIERMLRQMQLANVFKHTKGVLLGSFNDCEPQQGKPSLSLQEVFEDIFSNTSFPVLGELKYGHIDNLQTIPIGVRASMDTATATIQFLESAVK